MNATGTGVDMRSIEVTCEHAGWALIMGEGVPSPAGCSRVDAIAETMGGRSMSDGIDQDAVREAMKLVRMMLRASVERHARLAVRSRSLREELLKLQERAMDRRARVVVSIDDLCEAAARVANAADTDFRSVHSQIISARHRFEAAVAMLHRRLGDRNGAGNQHPVAAELLDSLRSMLETLDDSPPRSFPNTHAAGGCASATKDVCYSAQVGG